MKNRAILFLVLFMYVIPATGESPTSVVQKTVKKVMSTLSNKNLSSDKKWRVIADNIGPTFDFKSLSQTTLESNWKDASKEDKKKLIEYFSQYLEDMYRTKMTGFVPSRIEYVSEQTRKNRAIVDSFIYSLEKKVFVSYRLKNKEDGWYIYDIFINDESVVDNWKEVFSAIIKSEGLEGLLNRLELKIVNSTEQKNSEASRTNSFHQIAN